MFRKLIIIFIGLIVIFSVVVGIVSRKHPIILKWLVGSARIIGKPIPAIVYTDGKVNNGINVYRDNKYWDDNKPNSSLKANTYLLRLREFDKSGKLEFINVNLDETWVGRPVGVSKTDYDLIQGCLFQSDIGGHFVPFTHPEKGYNFDPKLAFTKRQINFNIPPNNLKFNSIRIELP